ncbi:nitrogen regulatory protein PII [Planomicrobium stackebrandtii]|uniref:Nitrogen regulatory protein PII n=1 Tax=Planomicrobium stackebrandtii TaxID=253160 RepID=A0ABU0GRF0_9BACL|nr:P-II family nitrogen regulator [Planomicrobium stackebrandtii]MDQ0427939.1 nitrogen regulatory protein PII [Planomicrobium stackebrandtii]
MVLNHRLMIAIVKRGHSRDVIAAAKHAGVDGATVIYGEGIGRNEKPTFFGLPATHEKDVIFLALDGQLESGVAQAVSKAGELGKPGYGLGFTVHLSKLLGVPHLSERSDDRRKKRGAIDLESAAKDFQLIVTIVNSGDSAAVVKAASKAGAEGGTILNGRGTGVNEQQKFMNFTIDPEKDVVLTLVPASYAEGVIRSIEEAVDLNAPGKGIAFLIDVENVFGVNHSSFDRHNQQHRDR